MIWLIGCNGMLGKEFSCEFRKKDIGFVESDLDVDITDLNALKKFSKDKNISWIINCSAYTAVDKAEKEKSQAELINVFGTKNIAEVAKQTGAKLIHFSTDYVFDGELNKAYIETDKTNPQSVYGETKLESKKVIIEAINNYFIFRISWLYGINGGNFVETMLRFFSEKDEMGIVSDQVGAPTYTFQLVENIIKMISDKSDKFGTYHYSDDAEISWYDFAVEIKKTAFKNRIKINNLKLNPITTEEFPTLAKRPKNSRLNKNKVKKELKFKIYDWKDNLKDYFHKKISGD